MSLPSWTPERVATLERLWTDGLSASEIAARFPGITRNAVLGKLHRLGRLGRGRPTASTKSRKVKPPRAPSVRRPKPPARMRPPVARASVAMPSWAGEVTRVEALQSWHCRWPIGDPHDAAFAFCGRRVAARPYCGDHRAVAYQPASGVKAGAGAKGRGSRKGPA
jgi:GcrA cell cycle regulator